jgi:hypothetical protein
MESFQGPVEVQNYLPRKHRLATGEKKDPERFSRRKDGGKKRGEARTNGMGETPRSPIERVRKTRDFGRVVSGNADRVLEEVWVGKGGDIMAAGMVGVEHFEWELGKCCHRCEELGSEVQRLRDEVKSLRRLVEGKGKGKAVIVSGDA